MAEAITGLMEVIDTRKAEAESSSEEEDFDAEFDEDNNIYELFDSQYKNIPDY